MTNEKMEQRLAAALEKTAPDDVNGVLSRCEERKGTVIPMTTKKMANRKWTTLVAACLAVLYADRRWPRQGDDCSCTADLYYGVR